MIQSSHKKKHFDIIVKHCTVEISRTKIKFPSEQSTKILKTTIECLLNTLKLIAFDDSFMKHML